jgi:thiosulfate/3-mercaptopyruvate sulfurtransferase
MPTHDQLRELIESDSWLIEADQLEGLLGEPSVKVFDVRGTWSTPARALSEDYAAGHIPGAVFLDWTAHFIEQGVALAAAAVADEASAKQAFKTLGINEGDLVVLYDDNSHMFAGRIWWAMRYWGFAGVRVLNGGWKNWSAQKKPISNESPQIAPGTFQPRVQENLLVGLDAFIKEKDGSCVIDGRGANGFAGNPDDPRTGHVPGSLNVPFSAVLDADTGLFLDRETLSRVFDERAPEWHEAPIITTCGAGYSATVILLALSQIDRTGRLFDGSFAVWKQDPDRPVSQSKPT